MNLVMPMQFVLIDTFQLDFDLSFQYLDAVFSKNPMDSRDFHTAQVSFYADYESEEKLMNFLRKAGNYNLQEAISICTKKSLNRALVFLFGKGMNIHWWIY